MSKKKSGGGYTVKTYKVYNSIDEVDFEELPDSFVIKCTHDSHSVFVVKDKNKADKKKILKTLKKHLKRNLYYFAKEWPYKDVKPRIIVEELLNKDSKDTALIDYKWFCFNGEPKVMYICKDTSENPKISFYDMNFIKLKMWDCDPMSDEVLEKPECFEKMKEISTVLSKGMSHVRVDFYIDSNGKLYVGEMTFFHCGGLQRFHPEDAEQMMGSYIDLNELKKS